MLAYGHDDKLAASHRVLAAALPPRRVLVVPGGHDWEPWQAAWRQFVEAGFVERGAEAGFSGAAASSPAREPAAPPSAPR